MAALQNFRSALNGFHREDVVRYIEYINNAHAAQIGQMNTELQQLRAQVKALSSQPKEDNTALIQELEDTKTSCQQLDAALQEKADHCTALELSLAEAQAQAAELEQEAGELRRQLEQARLEATQELEAYRRAERTERLAAARVAQLYSQANGILADATVRAEETAGEVGSMAEQVAAQLGQLQAAVLSSKDAFAEAAAALYAVRPIDPNS